MSRKVSVNRKEVFTLPPWHAWPAEALLVLKVAFTLIAWVALFTFIWSSPNAPICNPAH